MKLVNIRTVRRLISGLMATSLLIFSSAGAFALPFDQSYSGFQSPGRPVTPGTLDIFFNGTPDSNNLIRNPGQLSVFEASYSETNDSDGSTTTYDWNLPTMVQGIDYNDNSGNLFSLFASTGPILPPPPGALPPGVTLPDPNSMPPPIFTLLIGGSATPGGGNAIEIFADDPNNGVSRTLIAALPLPPPPGIPLPSTVLLLGMGLVAMRRVVRR